ncbi:serine/threonine-protein kinase [Nonomuraea phyllanthi]|uniref:serine/threonine-protein kinase n=1 Tax=Nonomuraea phyllanthi TaxID=2219224 RepID=UPI00294FFB66|nr:protein kinase [Nonomuraea phyllanthi]
MEQEGTSLMEPTGAAPLRPTDLREIGPYRLLGRLGEGGMGTVFLARAPTGRFVALKVVKAEFANQEGFAARFHAEVENARRVASFCTAQVLDNGNTGDGRPYMVTEYIAGTPLSDQITTYGALEPGALHGVALGVAAALAAIHVAGLVHRDLKPANVILSLSGPRVIDFGIARALDRETGFTLSGELLGSPGWWAPEQVRGEAVSPAVDIFAWGCLVAYAGNGRHPFGRGDPITLATRVLNNPPDLGVLPAPLNELVRRATSMDPGPRPTAQDLLIALVGGSAPARVSDPPTLVATEMLSDWQPPQNVVDEPDITATFATPPPSDATKEAPNLPGGPGVPGGPAAQGGPNVPNGPGAQGGPNVPSGAGAQGGPGARGGRGVSGGPRVPGGDAGSGPPGAFGGQAGTEDAPPPQQSQASIEELARREEEAAKEEFARWEAQARERERAQAEGLERQKQLAWQELARQEQDKARGQEAQRRQHGQHAPGQHSQQRQQGQQGHGQHGQGQQGQLGFPGGATRPGDPGAAGLPGDAGTARLPGDARVTGLPQGSPAAARHGDSGTVALPGDPGTVSLPGDEPDTLGGTRTKGTRWLVAAAAAVVAVVVTTAVLIVTSTRTTTVTTTPGTPSRAAATAGPSDVGRRFALGAGLDDPIAIVGSAPQCGLKEFEGRAATQGQLCVIPWTMINPGGERRQLIQPVVTMVDDRGGEHDPAPVTLPPAILPGARVDSAFVFDLAMYRKPVQMTATMLENGKQIEVRLG